MMLSMELKNKDSAYSLYAYIVFQFHAKCVYYYTEC